MVTEVINCEVSVIWDKLVPVSVVVPWLKVTFKLDFFTVLEVVSNPELVCTGCVTTGIIVGVILRLTEVSLCVLVWCTVVSAEVPIPLVVTELSSVQCGNEDVVFSSNQNPVITAASPLTKDLDPLALKVKITPASAFSTVTSRHRTTSVGSGMYDKHPLKVLNSFG